MNIPHLVLLVFAFVCAVIATYYGDAPYRKLIAAALAFYFASLFL